MNGILNRILLGALLVATMAACSGNGDGITIDNKYFSYTFSNKGKNQSFISQANRKDYLFKDSVSYISHLIVDGKVFYPDNIAQEGTRLIINFGNAGATAYLSYTHKSDYIVFSVDSVSGKADAFTFLNIPLIVEALPDEPFHSCVLALNLNTHVEQLPGLQNHLWATGYDKFGIKGAAVALVGVPQNLILPAIQTVMKTEAAIPFSDKGGAWAQSNKEGYGSYLMDFGSLTLKTVDDWIAKCDSLGFNQIAIHGANQFFKNGELELFRDKWPGGWNDFKKINERLHQAGISSILLTYAYFVDKKSNLVNPLPSADLGYFNAYTLEDSIGAYDTEIVVRESTADVSTIVGYFIQNSVIVRIGDELIEFSGVTDTPPYTFTGVKRGVLGTKAQKHAKGEKGFHLMQMFDQFVAGPETQLFDEIAKKTAQVVNENNFDGIYFDAIDGNNMLGGKENAWYYGSKFIVKVAEHLNPMVGMEMCDMPHLYWHYSSRWQAWDKAVRGYKRFVDVHMAALKSDDHRHGEWIGYTKTIDRLAPVKNGRLLLPLHMGWWGNNTWESPQVETTFPDDIEYLLGKMIGNDAGMSMLGGTDEATLNEKPIFRKLVSLIKQYEGLRHAQYFGDKIKAQLRQPGDEFSLSQKTDGKWAFQPVVYDKHLATSDTASWTFDNPFSEQPVWLRIQHQMSVGNYNAPDNILLSASKGEGGWALDTIAKGVNSQLMVQRANDEKGDRLILQSRNTGQVVPEASWVKWQKKFENCLDLSRHKGLGVWIKGDSSGALVNLRLESPKHISMGARGDHFVNINFSGWKYFELVEIESAAFNNYLWPDEFHNVYNSYFYKVAFNCIDKLQIWLNNLPAGKEVNIEIGTIKALPLVENTIENPVIQIGENKLIFPVTMKPGMYMECSSAEDCSLFDAKGVYLKRVEPIGTLTARTGVNRVLWKVASTEAVTPRLEVAVRTKGDFIND